MEIFGLKQINYTWNLKHTLLVTRYTPIIGANVAIIATQKNMIQRLYTRRLPNETQDGNIMSNDVRDCSKNA